MGMYADYGLASEEEKNLALQLQEKFPDTTPGQCIRFLRARNHDLKKAEDMQRRNLEWRSTYELFQGKVDLKALEAELRKDKCVYLGKTKDGVHVVLNQLNLMGRDTYDDFNVAIAAYIAIFEYLESILGPLEKFACAVTTKGLKRKHIDLEWARKITSLLQDNYPERLLRAYIAPVPAVLLGLWSFIKVFIDPDTRTKVRLGGSESLYLDHIDAEVLPEFVGGSRKIKPTSEDIINFVRNKYYNNTTESSTDILTKHPSFPLEGNRKEIVIS